jgi:hypothetical protein
VIRPVWNASLYAADRPCGEVDEEDFDTLKLMTTYQECADAMQGAGFDYFNFNGEGGDIHMCKGCLNDSQDFFADDSEAATAGVNIYKITPNYPVNMVDEANNQQCAKRCDSAGPGYDATLGDCMSLDNIRKVRVSFDAETDRIKKVEFGNWAPLEVPCTRSFEASYTATNGWCRRATDGGHADGSATAHGVVVG